MRQEKASGWVVSEAAGGEISVRFRPARGAVWGMEFGKRTCFISGDVL